MKLSEAIAAAEREAWRAGNQVKKLNGADIFGHAEAVELLEAARGLNCAAQEIERRMAGVPEPKRGD